MLCLLRTRLPFGVLGILALAGFVIADSAAAREGMVPVVGETTSSGGGGKPPLKIFNIDGLAVDRIATDQLVDVFFHWPQLDRLGNPNPQFPTLTWKIDYYATPKSDPVDGFGYTTLTSRIIDNSGDTATTDGKKWRTKNQTFTLRPGALTTGLFAIGIEIDDPNIDQNGKPPILWCSSLKDEKSITLAKTKSQLLGSPTASHGHRNAGVRALSRRHHLRRRTARHRRPNRR